jgi:acyl-CoA synthetase (AMP-forming)/AMP-acid ligase II
MPLLYDWLTRASKERAAARAIVFRDTYLSWHGLLHRVDRRARELGSMGIGRGHWVGLMLGNVPEFIVLTLALDRLGAVAVPMDPATSVKDLDMFLEAAPLRALVTRPLSETTTPMAPVAPPETPLPTRRPARATDKRITRPRTSELALRIHETDRAAAPRFAREGRRRLSGTLLNVSFFRRDAWTPATDERAPAVVLGTTDAGGDPKGILRSDAELEGLARVVGDGLALDPGQAVLLPVPFHSSFGFDTGLVLGLSRGLLMVLEDELAAKTMWRVLKESPVDYMNATPALLSTLARAQPVGTNIAHDVLIVCAHGPGFSGAAEAFRQRVGGRARQMYHTPETGPVSLDRPISASSPGRGGVGFALPGVTIRVAAPDGTRLPPGVPGQVWIRSAAASGVSVPRPPVPLRAVGQVGVPIGRKDHDGWLRTGAMGALNHEGRFSVTGREDDLVDFEGRRMATGEIEGCLENLANVRAAEVRVAFDDISGPIVIARVVANGDVRAEELIDHCARNLAPYKVPRQIELCAKLDSD